MKVSCVLFLLNLKSKYVQFILAQILTDKNKGLAVSMLAFKIKNSKVSTRV